LILETDSMEHLAMMDAMAATTNAVWVTNELQRPVRFQCFRCAAQNAKLKKQRGGSTFSGWSLQTLGRLWAHWGSPVDMSRWPGSNL
jgi:hypothetical protein